jgi:hypothetical protein
MHGTIRAALVPIVLSAIGCVTVNVYFPAAEVKDLSRRIEEQVHREAAQQEEGAAPAPTPPPPPPSGPRPALSVLDELLGVTPVIAQEVASPDLLSAHRAGICS